MDGLWVIGLSSWIVQDGNYPDFTEGEETPFAVEFYFHDVAVTSPAQNSARRVGGSTYDVTGEVLAAEADAWVVDCGGLSAYRDGSPPAGVDAGATVSGRAVLGVDPFFYFERLSKRPEMPALIYDWRIERIELATTPWMQVEGRTWVRDRSKESWREVDATDARSDDEGRAYYLLYCTKLPGLPRRQLQRSHG